MRSIWLLVSLGVCAGGCGGGDCLDGTIRHRDTCFPFDPFDKTPPRITVDPPVRTRSVGNITLVSDEPAEIFATLDDSPLTLDSPTHEPDELVIPNDSNDVVLRYFAVDLAGNQSEEQIVLWNIDSVGPSPASDFDLQRSGSQNSLTWQPPGETDFRGIVIARVEGRLTVAPTSGVTYEPGDTIGPGVTVVNRSTTETSFTETHTGTPGIVRYVAWAFDDLQNYGPPASDFELVDIPPQTGTLVINTSNGTISELEPAELIDLSGSASFAGGTVTAKITMRNDTSRVLFAPKLRLTGSLGSVTWTDADGLLDGNQFRSYGGAIAPGGSITTTWTFTNAIQGNLIAISFELVDNPILMTATGRNGSNDHSGSMIDEVTALETDRLAAGSPGTRGAHGTLGGAITADGIAVFGSRCTGSISTFDMQAGSRLLSKELRTQKAHVAQVAVDRGGGTGYALTGNGHIRNAYGDGSSVDTELVRFDVATLTEHGRIDIGPSRNRDMRISPDGKLLAIGTGVASEGALIVNLSTFKPVTNLIIAGRPEAVSFSADGNLIAVASNTEVRLFRTDEGFSESKKIALPPGGNRTFRIAFANNQLLYVARRNDLVKVDLTEAVAPATLPFSTRTMDVFDGKVYVGNGGIVRLDANDASELSYGVDQQSSHWLGRSPF